LTSCVDLDQLGAGDAIAHLLIGAGMPDLLAAASHDQRQRAYLVEVLHEVVRAHVQHETAESQPKSAHGCASRSTSGP
jgi:hypothetical protein